MDRDKGQTAEPEENQEDYEAAVLEFLDKEMAAVQPTKRQNNHSAELDSLVSDLLKLVITEPDQPEDVPRAVYEDKESLLAEFPPREEAATLGSQPLGLPPMNPPSPLDTEESAPEMPADEASKTQAPATPAASAVAFAVKRKTPLVAVASACLLVLVGIAIYYFASSTKSAPKAAAFQSSKAAPISPGDLSRAIPASDQPEGKAATRQPEVSRTLNEKPEYPASAVPERETAAAPKNVTPSSEPVPQTMKPVTIPEQKPASDRGAANPAVIQHAMNPAEAQSVPAPPLKDGKLGNPAPAMEKLSAAQVPALPPAAAPAIPAAEIKEAQPSPVAPPRVENPEPSPRAPAQTPAETRTLIPAVPVFQVSPSYPEMALKTRTSAAIVLDLQIDEQGKVVKAIPVSGPIMFHSSAVSATMKWRYKPASIGGTNVSSRSRVTLKFNLQQ